MSKKRTVEGKPTDEYRMYTRINETSSILSLKTIKSLNKNTLSFSYASL